MKPREEIEQQIEWYGKDIEKIQQQIQQLGVALQRTIGAKLALEELIKEESTEA